MLRATKSSLFAMVVFAACRTVSTADDVPVVSAAPPPVLAASPACPEAAAMLDAFHTGALSGPLAPVRARVADVLTRCPTAWEAHEVAALVARLDNHDDDATRHFMAAAADARATDGRFFLDEMLEQGAPVSLLHVELAFLDDVAAHHRDPAVRADAALHAVNLATRFDPARTRSVAGLGVIEHWRVVGAFDNDQGKGFLSTYPPEDHVDLDEEMAGRLVPVRWRPVTKLTRDGSVPIEDMVSPSQQSVAYAVTWLTAPTARSLSLVLTTNAAFRVFLNGKLVGEEQKVDALGPDAFDIPLALVAGSNELLVKSANETGAWTMRARVVDDAGSPVALESADAPASRARSKPAVAKVAAHVDIAPRAPGTSARSTFMQARTLARAGVVREALETARRYADASKESPLAVLLVSQLLKRNQEAGKAIDLLNKTVGDGPGGAGGGAPAALVLDRALFYMSKKRFDTAQDDLRAVLTRDPGTRGVLFTLASLYDTRTWKIDRCRVLDDGIARWPDDTALLREKADCLRDRGLRTDARAVFHRALALEPGSYGALHGLADLAIDSGDLDEAAGWLARTAIVDDTGTGPLIAQANLARIAHDQTKARALLDQARAIDPDNPVAYQRLGDLVYDDGALDAATRKDKALVLWREALKRDPQDSELSVHIEFVAEEGLGDLAKYAPSREDIARALKKAAQTPAAAGSNVVAIIDHEVTEVNADGSAKAVVTEVLQAVNQRGRDQLISFGVPRGETRILDAHSITPTGEPQEASSIAGGTIRFRNLDVGSITVVQYLTHRPPGGFLPNHYVSTWRFSGMQRDVRDATWIVIMPKDKKLVRHVQGAVDEKIVELGDKRVHTWHASDIPPLLPEPYSPPVTDLERSVSVSTLDGWDEYVRWEQALLKDAFRSNPEVDGLAARLLDGATTPRDKIDRLFKYVSKDIRYTQEYETTIAGVKPHACPVVLERGYGDCKDKAVLLILLLKKAGVDADFAILRTTDAGAVNKDVPNQQFNHAIVFVPKQAGIDEGFFTDPTTDALDLGNLRSDDQGATSLVLEPEGSQWHFEQIAFQPAALEDTKTSAAIDAATMHAKVDVSARGAVASSVRRAVRDAETERKVMQNWGAVLWPGSTLVDGKADTSEDLSKPFTMTVNLDIATGVHDDADGVRYDVPKSTPFAAWTQLAERKLPLRLGIAATSSLDVTLAIPPGKKVLRTPVDFHVTHPCFNADRTTTTSPTAVHLSLNFTKTCFEIPAADYAAFRAKALEVVSREQDPIVLSK